MKKKANTGKEQKSQKEKKLKDSLVSDLQVSPLSLATVSFYPPDQIVKQKYFALSPHGARNILADPKQSSLFSNPEEEARDHSEKYGIGLNSEIREVGANLTDSQFKTMEGILKAFEHSAEKGYTGNMPPKDPKELIREGTFDELPTAYKNIEKIPRIRINQSELFRLTGINENSIADKQRTLEALKYLGTSQFLFYYKRLQYDSKGKPVKDDKGNYKKEEVTVVDTIFRVKTVTDDQTKNFKYYEVEPTATFLDQIKNYFLLIPVSWREEVKAIMGGKEISSYTMKFLVWLRLQYEERRRKHYKNFEIRKSWEEIAQILKMPETLYKRNKKTARDKYLLTAYETAVKTGYLTSYRREPHIDILVLNESKYFTPQGSKELTE